MKHVHRSDKSWSLLKIGERYYRAFVVTSHRKDSKRTNSSESYIESSDAPHKKPFLKASRVRWEVIIYGGGKRRDTSNTFSPFGFRGGARCHAYFRFDRAK